MEPIKKGQISSQIRKATVIFPDNKSLILEIRTLGATGIDSYCHFFPKRFSLDENQEVQLRVDWNDLVDGKHPTLDADFYDKNTGQIVKKLSLAQKKSHQTKPICKEDKRLFEKNTFYDSPRCYEWLCEGNEAVIPPFKIIVEWLSSFTVTCSAKMTVTGTVIKGG